MGAEFEETADRAVEQAHRVLVGSGRSGASVSSVLWYGAVDKDRNLR